MSNSIDKEVLKNYLKDYLINFHGITNMKKSFHCLNPNHTDNNPSMHFSFRYNICKCFSCDIRYDVFDLIKLDYGLDTFKEQYNKLLELFNINNIQSIPTKEEISYEIKDYSKYFMYCYSNICKTDYLTRVRDIAGRLIDKYKIGYDESKQKIIFPINKNCYFARSVNSNEKYKSSGISYLWNEDLISTSTDKDYIYLTESIIDALSLETINPDIKAVSLNGVTNVNRLLNLLDNNSFTGTFVIAFNNDNKGIEYSNILKEELKNRQIKVFNNSTINCNYNDINQALTNDKEKLESNLEYFNTTIEKVIENYKTKEEDNQYEV